MATLTKAAQKRRPEKSVFSVIEAHSTERVALKGSLWLPLGLRALCGRGQGRICRQGALLGGFIQASEISRSPRGGVVVPVRALLIRGPSRSIATSTRRGLKGPVDSASLRSELPLSQVSGDGTRLSRQPQEGGAMGRSRNRGGAASGLISLRLTLEAMRFKVGATYRDVFSQVGCPTASPEPRSTDRAVTAVKAALKDAGRLGSRAVIINGLVKDAVSLRQAFSLGGPRRGAKGAAGLFVVYAVVGQLYCTIFRSAEGLSWGCLRQTGRRGGFLVTPLIVIVPSITAICFKLCRPSFRPLSNGLVTTREGDIVVMPLIALGRRDGGQRGLRGPVRCPL